jgi:hypothetical protein
MLLILFMGQMALGICFFLLLRNERSVAEFLAKVEDVS